MCPGAVVQLKCLCHIMILFTVGPPNPWECNDPESCTAMLEAVSSKTQPHIHTHTQSQSSSSFSHVCVCVCVCVCLCLCRLLQSQPVLHKLSTAPPAVGRSATHTLLDGLQKIHALPYQLKVEGSREGYGSCRSIVPPPAPSRSVCV